VDHRPARWAQATLPRASKHSDEDARLAFIEAAHEAEILAD